MKLTTLSVAAALTAVLFAGAAGAADVKEGEKVFRKCKACHKVEEGKKSVGPHLFGIVGRSVAGVEGYKYSKAMVEYGSDGAVWDAGRLDAYLNKPKDEVKGTKMAFAGLRKDADRENIIAYLETLK